MDATSMALCHTKVEEIRRRISEGELTAQQIHDILISEIENELNRPTKEVNMAYVKICEECTFYTDLICFFKQKYKADTQ